MRRPRRGLREAERGSAAVEFAMILPAVAVVLGLVGAAAQYGVALVRAQDAASAAARLAITDPDGVARESALSIAGADATVRLERAGGWIRVAVTLPAPWGLSASATAVTRDQG